MPKKHTTSNKTRKRKGKDMDQIIEEIRSEKRRCFTVRQINFDLDLPGDGQFYCVECDRHFIDEKSLRSHRSSKGTVLFILFNKFFTARFLQGYFSQTSEICNHLDEIDFFLVHRQRLKRLREPVYTQHEAEESVGLKTTLS
ncbi:unnamed protein product [Wuchereria bancrofti]|uniref:Zinc finger double-stranded RNA binding domain-containing protein n=1 Tax=Wuchereria bancrofti TaxID=6293 RepID=A0A3P7DWS8_WUCBA|nr:unnamed protein product [Wuchereria bancrofti]